MSRSKTKIERLIMVQEGIFDKDYSNFTDAMTTVELIENEILELQSKLEKAPLDMGIDASELPYWSRHNIWIERRIVGLTQNLATARAIAEERKQQLSRANGRLSVVKKIGKKS